MSKTTTILVAISVFLFTFFLNTAALPAVLVFIAYISGNPIYIDIISTPGLWMLSAIITLFYLTFFLVCLKVRDRGVKKSK